LGKKQEEKEMESISMSILIAISLVFIDFSLFNTLSKVNGPVKDRRKRRKGERENGKELKRKEEQKRPMDGRGKGGR